MDSSTQQTRLLSKSVEDLRIQNEVEEVVQELLWDVELAVTTNQSLTRQIQQQELKERTRLCEATLREVSEIQNKERQETAKLNDELLKEILVLSKELTELKQWKQRHEATTMEHNHLVAKLEKVQKEILHLRSLPTEAAPPPETQDGDPTERIPPESAASGLQVTIEQSEEQEIPAQKSDPDDTVHPTRGDNSSDIDQSPSLVEDHDQPQQKQQQPESSNAEEGVAIMASLQEDQESPSLGSIDPEILLSIFNFLEATEILSLAQVNIAFFSRVDSLFGMSESTEAPAEAPVPPVPAPIPAPAPKPDPVSQLRSTPPQPSKPVQPPKPAPVKAAGLFGILTPPSSPPLKPLSPPRQPSPAASNTVGGSSGGLNSSLAKSMEAKLNDKEINAIISITKSLRQAEFEVRSLQSQSAQMQNKIDGTEAVKEFLVGKARELENSLNEAVSERAKWNKQISADQEVISYLDARVQELERNERGLVSGNQRLANQVLKTQADSKVAMLTDMLHFEQDKGRVAERERKATRRVLKKEVKQNRLAVKSLQKERDVLRQKNQQLQGALLSSSRFTATK